MHELPIIVDTRIQQCLLTEIKVDFKPAMEIISPRLACRSKYKGKKRNLNNLVETTNAACNDTIFQPTNS